MSIISGNTLHQSQIITLKSREYTQRLNGQDNSDILFQLAQPITCPPNVDIYATMHQFRFINAVYNVPNSTHILYWRTLNGVTWTDYSYAVQVGNWTIDALIADLNAAQNDIDFIYDPKTFRVKIHRANNSHDQIDILPNANNINARIGFSETSITTLLPVNDVNNPVISPNLIDLLGMQNMYVCIEDLQVGSNTTLGFSQKNSAVIEHIPVIVPQGTGQVYSGNGLMHKCGVRKITQLRVQLFTGEGILAELNNSEWYLTLILNFQYENEFKAPRYFSDVNGDGRVDVNDLLALFSSPPA